MSEWTSPGIQQDLRGLGFGALAPPIAWGVQLLVSYGIDALGCSTNGFGFTILGLTGSQAVAALFTLGIEAVIVAAFWVSWHNWRKVQQRDQARGSAGNAEDRWLAFSGLLLSGLFFVTVLFQGIPDIVLRPCR